jgi:hypothetical protein
MAPDGPVLAAGNVNFCCLSGHIGGFTHKNDQLEIKVDRFQGDFGAITLVPLDGMDLQSSKRLLLTVCGQVENQGMKWNAQRTSVGNDWGEAP